MIKKYTMPTFFTPSKDKKAIFNTELKSKKRIEAPILKQTLTVDLPQIDLNTEENEKQTEQFDSSQAEKDYVASDESNEQKQQLESNQDFNDFVTKVV